MHDPAWLAVAWSSMSKILHASCQQIKWTKYCMQAVNKSNEQNTACKPSTNQMNKILHASCQQIKWTKYCMQAVNKSNEQNTACKLSTKQMSKILHASCQPSLVCKCKVKNVLRKQTCWEIQFSVLLSWCPHKLIQDQSDKDCCEQQNLKWASSYNGIIKFNKYYPHAKFTSII